MTHPPEYTRDQIIAAVEAAAFPTEDGRSIHSLIGGFGADWDADAVVDAVRRAQAATFGPDILGHHLTVIQEDGTLIRFDVPTPEPATPPAVPEPPAGSPYQVAPWPTRAGDATADTVARHALAAAQVHIGALDRYPTSSREWVHTITILGLYYCEGLLLRRFAETDRAAADAAAAELFNDLEDGGSVHEWTWQWLTGYGIDADALRGVGERIADHNTARTLDAALDRAGKHSYEQYSGQDWATATDAEKHAHREYHRGVVTAALGLTP